MDARDMVFGPEPYVSRCLETAPRRSHADIRLELRRERIKLLYRQLQAETDAADCLRRIENIDARLRMIDAAIGDATEMRVVGSLDAIAGQKP